MMRQITIDVPEESLMALRGIESDRLGSYLLMAAGVKLFEMGTLSSGAAAQLAGVPRTVFLGKLADFGVDTFSLSKEEIAKEVRLA